MKSNRFALIGAFLIGALIIVAIAFALFFGGALGKTKSRAVMVFRGNVTGLEVGTPVQFRGMKIGEVKRVRTIYNPEDRQVLFPVYAEFTGTIEVPGYEKSSDAPGVRDAWLSGMVQRGLRASLQTKSFVTGQQMIMLDFEEAKPPVFAKIEADLLEIPTTISPNESLVETFKELPVREMVIEGRQMLNNINQLMVDAQGKPGPLPNLLKQITSLTQSIDSRLPLLSSELTATAKDTRRTLASAHETLVSARDTLQSFSQTSTLIGTRADKLGAAVEGNSKDFSLLSQRIQDSMGVFDRALASVEGSLKRVDQSLGTLDQGVTKAEKVLGSAERTLGQIEFAISDDSAIGYGLAKTLEEVASAAKSLRHTVDAVNRKPSSLLFGNRDEK